MVSYNMRKFKGGKPSASTSLGLWMRRKGFGLKLFGVSGLPQVLEASHDPSKPPRGFIGRLLRPSFLRLLIPIDETRAAAVAYLPLGALVCPAVRAGNRPLGPGFKVDILRVQFFMFRHDDHLHSISIRHPLANE